MSFSMKDESKQRNTTFFEANVREAAEALKKLGYKVELQQISGHYSVKGSAYETWNQHGFAIKVFPHKDR